MLTASQLSTFATTSDAAISRMEKTMTALNASIEKIEGDTTRSREYIVEACKAARDKAIPALAEDLKVIQAAHQEAAPNKEFWSSRPLVLSLQPFDQDAAKDAQIRVQHAIELKAMPLPVLDLTFKNARFDGDLPMLYACWLTGAFRSVEAGFNDSVNLSLEGIDLPGQDAALAAIAQCHSNRGYGESMWSAAVALRSDPVRKLTVARERQAASRMVDAASGV